MPLANLSIWAPAERASASIKRQHQPHPVLRLDPKHRRPAAAPTIDQSNHPRTWATTSCSNTPCSCLLEEQFSKTFQDRENQPEPPATNLRCAPPLPITPTNTPKTDENLHSKPPETEGHASSPQPAPSTACENERKVQHRRSLRVRSSVRVLTPNH